jgi:hypothetical protein
MRSATATNRASPPRNAPLKKTGQGREFFCAAAAELFAPCDDRVCNPCRCSDHTPRHCHKRSAICRTDNPQEHKLPVPLMHLSFTLIVQHPPILSGVRFAQCLQDLFIELPNSCLQRKAPKKREDATVGPRFELFRNASP